MMNTNMFVIRGNLVFSNRLKYLLLNRQICSAYYDHQGTICSSTLDSPAKCNWNLKSIILSMKVKSGNIQNLQEFSSLPTTEDIDAVTYESVCSETLESLCEFFDDIIEKYPVLKTADVSFGDGVLTVNLDKFGTYVINRQSPNKQIWLSSPTSGPKRYDFQQSRNGWVYRHNDQTLHSLLQEELSAIVKSPVDLSNCCFCGDC